MNKKIQLKSLSIVLCGVLGLNSCRPIDAPIPVIDDQPDNPKKSVVVPIGITADKSYENDESVISGDNQMNFTVFNPNEFKGAFEVKRILKNYPTNETLGDGTHYRVLAYRKDGNSHVLEVNEDFVLGSDKKLDLDKTKKYTLIIYSFGDRYVIPEPSNASNIDKVSIDYTKAKTLFYDREEDYTPSEKNERLKIKLKHQFTGIKIVLDASDYFGGVAGHMTGIKDAKLTYKGINKAIFNLGNGKSTIESSNREISINQMAFKGSKESKESNWKYIILSPDNDEIAFEAQVLMDKPMDGIDLGKIKTKINVKTGARQTIKISPQLCGALINNGAWKQFMCYEVGAYEGYSYPIQQPFEPAKPGSFKESALHGAKFQWGYPNNGAKMISATYDYNPKNNGTIKSSRPKDYSASWNDQKTPCPEGYRLPTRKELEDLAKFKFYGRELRYGRDNGGSYNFQGGYTLDPEKGSLYLPATGDRRADTSYIRFHGLDTNMWASDADSTGNYVYELNIDGDSSRLKDDKEKKVRAVTKFYYFNPVRCVKK